MQLLRLKSELDMYHQSRANKHGYIYYLNRVVGPSQRWPHVVEGKSLATGCIVTLVAPFFEVEEAEDD